MSQVRLNFVRQQGFEDASAVACGVQYPALMFQPRLVGALVLVGVLFQSAAVFLTLSAVLWWSALVPAFNPFDRLYNGLVAARNGLPPLSAAPPPRRFSQGMAATFMLAIGISLAAGWNRLAWTLEALVLVVLAALVFGSLCVGSYVFHVLSGNREFARRTLPWFRGA